MNQTQLKSEWQSAFAEWHLHRTDETAKVEQLTRSNYLTFIRELRRAKSSLDSRTSIN